MSPGLGGGALTSLFLSLARIAAASSGINPDLMQESLINAGVDLAGGQTTTPAAARSLLAFQIKFKNN